jgi:hypothetical protein
MAGGKGKRASDHAEFDQPITQSIKSKHDGKRYKFTFMVSAQGKGDEEAHRSHFPEHCD